MSDIGPESGKKPGRFRPLDNIVIIALLIVAAVVAAKVVWSPSPASSRVGDTVRVYRESSVVAEYPLDHNRFFPVEGRLGTVEVEVKDKRVRVVSSNCLNRVCMHMGWINRPDDQFIICAPNRILVRIEASGKNNNAGE